MQSHDARSPITEANKNMRQGLHVVGSKSKSGRSTSNSGYNPGVRDAIIRMTYSEFIRPRSFRQIANLLQVPESVVKNVITQHTRPITPYVGRAA
jgi:hypothetical protein